MGFDRGQVLQHLVVVVVVGLAAGGIRSFVHSRSLPTVARPASGRSGRGGGRSDDEAMLALAATVTLLQHATFSE